MRKFVVGFVGLMVFMSPLYFLGFLGAATLAYTEAHAPRMIIPVMMLWLVSVSVLLLTISNLWGLFMKTAKGKKFDADLVAWLNKLAGE
jgi:hypothetical protein